MNIYHSIYCFFYKLWEKRGTDGRFAGALHLLFMFFMNLLLLDEIYQDLTGYELMKIPEFISNSKIILIIIFAPFQMAIMYYFNTDKTSELLEVYENDLAKNESKASLWVLLFVIIPVILILALSSMRHKGYF